MSVDVVVKVHCRRGSTSLLAKGKGAHREVGSGGSQRQSHGLMPHTRLDRPDELAQHSKITQAAKGR